MGFEEVLDLLSEFIKFALVAMIVYSGFMILRYSFLKGEGIIKGKSHFQGILKAILNLMVYVLVVPLLTEDSFPIMLLMGISMLLQWSIRRHSFFVKEGFVFDMLMIVKWKKIKEIKIDGSIVKVIADKKWFSGDHTTAELTEENIERLKLLMLEHGISEA